MGNAFKTLTKMVVFVDFIVVMVQPLQCTLARFGDTAANA